MLSGLKLKRQELINELELMITSVGTETRSLSEEEVAKFDGMKKEIENIDATIKRVEETRFNNMTKEEKKVVVEKRSQEEIEARALEAYFRGHDMDEEMRATLKKDEFGAGKTIPVTIAQGLIRRLEEMCPVLERAKRFSSKGTLRLLDETSYGVADIKNEEELFHEDNPILTSIELNSYKVTAMTKATFELIANSSIDLNAYLTDIIIKRLAKQLNKYFLVGTGLGQPQGITKSDGMNVVMENNATIKYDDIVKMITQMHPDHLNDAVFVCNRDTFGKLALLDNGVGGKYMQNGVINGKFTYTLAGIPVIIDQHMDSTGQDSKVPLVLVNIGESYSINLLQDIVVRRLDQLEFNKGVEVFAGYVMADGRITNKDAIVVLKTTA